MELVEDNIKLLPQDLQQKHHSITDDAMDYIKQLPDTFDVIILDPPAFAKHIKSKNKAVQGYKRLNTRAIEKIKPGGISLHFPVLKLSVMNYLSTSYYHLALWQIEKLLSFINCINQRIIQ